MSTTLIVFAKAPVAGLVKTRLIPALGAQGAARLAQQMLTQSVQQALQTPFDHLELCVSPDTTNSAFAKAQALSQGRLHLSVQGDGDLGQRMQRAFERCLALHDSVLLMGTDAPNLKAAVLIEAAQLLRNNDAVFVPAFDGGYALLGLRRLAPELFDGMRWSTPEVMSHSRAGAAQAGLRWRELAPVADIDEPADLCHVPPDWLNS